MYVNKVQLTVSSEWHLFIGKWKSLPTQETSEIDYQTSEKWNVYIYIVTNASDVIEFDGDSDLKLTLM